MMELEQHRGEGIELLRRMKRIRLVEEAIAARYGEQEMRCPVHLSIGQEGVAAAAGMTLSPRDTVFSTHRCHAHYLGCNGDLKAMLAELHGKAAGCTGGRGGSMHLYDNREGLFASTAIVGNSIPLAAGAALAHQLQSSGQVSAVFFGDAGVEEGVFHETVNFAVLKRLPVIFICENNLYSVYTHLRDRQPEGRRIADWVAGSGIPTVTGDGNDAWATYGALRDGVHRVRAGGGPVFFEFSTYRWREHCGPNYDNDLGYRTEQEFLDWKKLDPVVRLQARLLEAGMLGPDELARMETEMDTEIRKAFDFARAAPFPPEEEAFTKLYAP